MQFGFMKGKGTTDAIFMARQMQENFIVKGKKLYFGFVDLEKAFDRVPKEVISWAMRKLGVEEWLVLAVMSMYTGAKTGCPGSKAVKRSLLFWLARCRCSYVFYFYISEFTLLTVYLYFVFIFTWLCLRGIMPFV